MLTSVSNVGEREKSRITRTKKEFQLAVKMDLILLLTYLTRLVGDLVRQGFSSSEDCLIKSPLFCKHSVFTILASETDTEATPIPTEAICDPHLSNQLAYTVIPSGSIFCKYFTVRGFIYLFCY